MYLSRVDYGDLTLSFRALFAEEADERFGIEPTDTPARAKDKADVTLELLPGELARPVITDVVLEDVNALTKRQRSLERQSRSTSRPTTSSAPTRPRLAGHVPPSRPSVTRKIHKARPSPIVLKQAPRLCARERALRSAGGVLGGGGAHLREIMRPAEHTRGVRERGGGWRGAAAQGCVWSAPTVDYYTDEHVPVQAERAALVSATNPKRRSSRRSRLPERRFKELLLGPTRESRSLVWWYKNGDERPTYFLIHT